MIRQIQMSKSRISLMSIVGISMKNVSMDLPLCCENLSDLFDCYNFNHMLEGYSQIQASSIYGINKYMAT